MNTLVGFSAPRAGFLARALFVIQLVSLSITSFASVSVRDCGDTDGAPHRYIVRSVANSGVSAQSISLVEQLANENPERIIHRSFENPSGSVTSDSQKPTEKSTLTIVTQLNDDQVLEVSGDTHTLSIEQDCLVHLDSVTPNDPVPAANQFVWDQLRLRTAWSQRTDSSSIIVAVSDTGVDLTHEDLSQNIWTNTRELNGRSGIDDDGNGCIDDIHGCDFGDSDGDPSPFSGSEGVHGTHVAGIIGAQGNNSLGSVGVSWRAQLMSVKGFNSSGNAYTSDLLNTIYYAVNNGARVINCSWGANRTPSQAEKDAFQFAIDSGALPVVAAGNSAIDAANSTPAGIDSVLTVGSVNSLDQVSSFSNFGSHVHVYASGGDAGTRNEYIYSTLPGNSYGLLRGTSMATPFVAGIAALIFAVNPKLSAVDVKTILINSSRQVSSVLPDGSTSLIKIPDANAALLAAATYTPTPFGVTSVPASGPTRLSSPTISAAPAQTSQSSSGCALHYTTSPDWMTVLAMLFPVLMAFSLRRRGAVKQRVF